MEEIDPAKILSDIVMFDGASNVQLAGRLLKMHCPKLTVMRGVEHTVALFYNYISKITIGNHMISAHKMIYNIFASSIYNKPHSIFKSKYQEFHNRHIGLFSVNETRMAGYFMGMHRDLWMRKVFQTTILSAEFIGIPTNNCFDKIFGYIHDNKSWERCYVLIKIMFPCLRVLLLEDGNMAGMEILLLLENYQELHLENNI